MKNKPKQYKPYTQMTDSELRRWLANIKDEISSRQATVRILRRELRNRTQSRAKKAKEIDRQPPSKMFH